MRRLISLPLIIGFLVMSQNASMAYEAQDLWVDALIYRSKIDNTDIHRRKLDLLLKSKIEKDSRSDVIARKDEIDSNPSVLDSVFSLATAIPGKAGIVANGYQYLRDNNSHIANVLGGNAGPHIENWEGETRKLANTVFQLAKNDPAFANLVDEVFGNRIPPVMGTEDEIISALPDFQDHITIRQLLQDVRANTQSNDDILKLIKTTKDDLKKLLDQQAATNNYVETNRKIEEWSAYGQVLTRLVSEVDSDAGFLLGTAVSAYTSMAKLHNSFTNNMLSGGAYAANATLVAFALLDSFSNKPSPHQIMMDEIRELCGIIIEQNKAILTNLEIVNDKLDTIINQLDIIYLKMHETQRSIFFLGRELQDLKRLVELNNLHTSAAARAIMSASLQANIGLAHGHKSTYRAGQYSMSVSSWNENFQLLRTASEVDSVLIAELDTSVSLPIEAVGTRLLAYPLYSSFPVIAQQLQSITGISIKQIEFDVELWLDATRALMELVLDWPNYQSSLVIDWTRPVEQRISDLRNFLEAIKYEENPEIYSSLASAIVLNGNQYIESLTENYFAEVVEDLRRREKLVQLSNPDEKLKPAICRVKPTGVVQLDRVWRQACRAITRELGRIRDRATWSTGKSFTVDSLKEHPIGEHYLLFENYGIKDFKYEGNWWNDSRGGTDNQLTAPIYLNQQFTPAIKLAFHLGIVDVDCGLGVSTGSHHLTCHAVHKASGKRYHVVEYRRYLPPRPRSTSSNGVTITIAPTYAPTIDPQKEGDSILAQLFGKNEYKKDHTKDIDALEDVLLDQLSRYFLNQFSNAINETDGGISDGVRKRRTVQSLLELLGVSLLLSDSILFNESDELLNALSGTGKPFIESQIRKIQNGTSISEWGKSYNDWDDDLIEVLDLYYDGAPTGVSIHTDIDQLDTKLKDIKQAIQTGSYAYSAYALQANAN